jgi:hypothetical protein
MGFAGCWKQNISIFSITFFSQLLYCIESTAMKPPKQTRTGFVSIFFFLGAPFATTYTISRAPDISSWKSNL